jgi:hypothetical protein
MKLKVEDAIKILQKSVKGSAIPGQNHLDLTLLSIDHQTQAKEAMQVIHQAIYQKEITMDEVKQLLGLP